jgi:hypothetical protein
VLSAMGQVFAFRFKVFQEFLVFFSLTSSSHRTGWISPLVLHHLAPVHIPGFLFRQPTRRGRHTRNWFSVIELRRSSFLLHSNLSGALRLVWAGECRQSPMTLSGVLQETPAKRNPGRGVQSSVDSNSHLGPAGVQMKTLSQFRHRVRDDMPLCF